MQIKDEFKICYSFHGWKWLWRQLMLSLTTLKRFIQDNIVVFYGEPRFQEHINWLKSRCDLRLVETPLHDEESMNKRVLCRNKFYGSTMKLHAYSLETPTMFWIDCDTIVHGDLCEMLKLDFDILVSKWQHSMAKTVLKGVCKQADLPNMECMLAGFVVFKHHAHNKIYNDYLEYWQKLFRNELHPGLVYRLEIYAFNLAVIKFRLEGGNVVEMPPDWNQYAGGRYVQHLARREIATWMEKRIFTPEMYELAEVGAENGKW